MQTDRRPPVDCYWSLTRACGQFCGHCRVDAGEPLPGELRKSEVIDVAKQIVSLGVSRVVLTGGDPSNHPAWEAAAQQLSAGGVSVRMFVSGRWLNSENLHRAQTAGVSIFTLSVDGPAEIHNRLRPGPEQFSDVMNALERLRHAGIPTRVVTTASAVNIPHLPAIYQQIRDVGVTHWQLQLLQPVGRARDALRRLMPQPAQLEDIVAILRVAAREGRVNAPMHCSIGYLTAEEVALRDRRQTRIWQGCLAGVAGFAIAPDGRVTGCACLPLSFATANVRQRRLADIWADDRCFPYSRQWNPDVLAGDCASCALAQHCRAGCMGISWSTTGTIGANPYCLRTIRS